MDDALNDLLSNISLLLIMTTPGDSAATDIILSLCDDVAQLAGKDAEHQRLLSAVQYVQAHKSEANVLDIVSAFASAAQQYLANAGGSVVFPGEQETGGKSSANPDISNAVAEEFLAEFIETHSSMLEDFELAITEFQQHGGDCSELTAYAKSYLHNLKGDSGSIGLLGIERVCHSLEDYLVQRPISDFLPQLRLFKEWANTWMKQLAAGKQPSVSAAAFLSQIEAESEQVVVHSPIDEAELQLTKIANQYQLTGEAEILLEFAVEAEEHLNNVESLILDSNGTYDKDGVDTIFRGVHSLKGGSAYFQLEEMLKSSHILENILSEVRDGKRSLETKLNSLLLTYIDLQKNILARAKQAVGQSGLMTTSQGSVDFLRDLNEYENTTGKKSSPVRRISDSIAKEPLSGTLPVAPPVPLEEFEQTGSKLQLKEFLKVDTARLDHLIDSIGEMVIYSSMLIRHCRDLLGTHQGVMDATHRVEKFSRDLQDVGMSLRLVPIKGLFQKMSRLVWDTSRKLGKNIDFLMQGEDTELDRNLIDKLADPLMHMVRNSLDHGIEGPEERAAVGKPIQGSVTLAAYHAGGSIHIQIKDDGRGLDQERILAKAVEKGIISAGQKLTQAEIYQLIFAPGFSTAATVTDISGRGVGMDVVRRNVESLRGRIHIQSEVGKGSTFTIELPLTLAIIEGIEIRIGTEHFIVPSLSIVEFVRPKPEMITNTLDYCETFHFRGKYLPIFRLSQLYSIRAEYNNPCEATIIVVENGHELVALMVDEVLGQCSTVIKSLGSTFDEGKGVAGCAIMPSGDVALILDIRSLIQLARISYQPNKTTLADKVGALV